MDHNSLDLILLKQFELLRLYHKEIIKELLFSIENLKIHFISNVVQEFLVKLNQEISKVFLFTQKLVIEEASHGLYIEIALFKFQIGFLNIQKLIVNNIILNLLLFSCYDAILIS